jgi:hypothetical protein
MLSFLVELDRIAADAHKLIESGDYKKALRLAKKLDRSAFCEGPEHAAKIFAKIDIRQGNTAKAKKHARNALPNSWGDPDLLRIIRLENPIANSRCKLFTLTVPAGEPEGSLLSLLPSGYHVSFAVLAQDQPEAQLYLKDALDLPCDYKIKIKSVTAHDVAPGEVDRCGVYWASPFERTSCSA